jgi:hypothetical protein
VTRSNCLFWALGQVRRHWRDGIGVWVRQSAYGWWPHFAVVRRVDPDACENFSPVGPKRRLRWWEQPMKALFKGEVRKGID